MSEPEIFRLRRFALGMGLILLTLSVAGVSLDETLRIAPFGLPLRISRPDLLPVGFALGSLYGLARYYYYGLMVSTSPYRARRDILDQLVPEGRHKPGTRTRSYWGPVEFESTPLHYDREKIERLASDIARAFPKFARGRVKANLTSHPGVSPEGDEYVSFGVAATIPVRCRLAALFEDLDYTSPVWFNVAALLVFVIRVL